MKIKQTFSKLKLRIMGNQVKIVDLQLDETEFSVLDVETTGLNPQKNRIIEIGFDGSGCVISQAAASMLTEFCLGKTVDEVLALTKDDILKLTEKLATKENIEYKLENLSNMLINSESRILTNIEISHKETKLKLIQAKEHIVELLNAYSKMNNEELLETIIGNIDILFTMFNNIAKEKNNNESIGNPEKMS